MSLHRMICSAVLRSPFANRRALSSVLNKYVVPASTMAQRSWTADRLMTVGVSHRCGRDIGINDDVRSGNAGKPQRHWRWIGPSLEAAAS